MKKLVFILFVAFVLGACGNEKEKQEGTEELSGTISIDGSSTVFPITEAIAEEFRAVQPKVNVTIGVSGTGGGFKKFCRGETDISNASRPILKAEMDICAKSGVKYFELPVAFDAFYDIPNKH